MVEMAGTPAHAYVGEWAPVTLLLQRPESSRSPVRIKHVSSLDRDVQVDIDQLENNVELRPGELYQLTVQLRADSPREVALDRLQIQVGDASGDASRDEAVHPPHVPLQFLPAIGREIVASIESLCSYETATRVCLMLKHDGKTPFTDLTVTLGPASAIESGKRVLHWPEFGPGREERVEVLVRDGELTIDLAARVGPLRTAAQHRRAIARLPGRPQRPQFRFLEPRRLSADLKEVWEVVGSEQRPVTPVHSIYPLHDGGRYLIAITPESAEVEKVELRRIENRVAIRHSERAENGRTWKFLVDVTFSDFVRKPERLYYEVRRKGETLTGELPLCLLASPWRHFRLAGALGAALTFQGVTALAHFLFSLDYSFGDALRHFQITSDYQLLFPLSIPLLWAGLRGYDWLQYRLWS
jgi:hypothetical protein